MSTTPRIRLPSIKELTKLPLLEKPKSEGLPTQVPKLPLIRYQSNYVHNQPLPALSPAAPKASSPPASTTTQPAQTAAPATTETPAQAPAAPAVPAPAPAMAPILPQQQPYGYMAPHHPHPQPEGFPVYGQPIYYQPVYYHPGAPHPHQLPLPPSLAQPAGLLSPAPAPPQYAVPEIINRSTNKCHRCGTTETPEWRRGPNGVRTLCNACGLFHAKLVKRKGAALAAEEVLNNKVTKGKNGRRILIKKHMLSESAAAAAAAAHHPMPPRHMAAGPMPPLPPMYGAAPAGSAQNGAHPYYPTAPYPQIPSIRN